jgi:hypothetical protein
MGLYLGPIRITRRGVRWRIGPRWLRLHGGAGGTGLTSHSRFALGQPQILLTQSTH